MLSDDLIHRFIDLELRAARLEGLFAADPDLGAMWRSAAALSEACRSVGLEDIHVTEGDVVHRQLENRATDAEGARGAEAASGLLRVMASPGDLTGSTGDVLVRCLRAAVSSRGERPDIDVASLVPGIRTVLSRARTPILGALQAATAVRHLTQARAPSAERLIFMAAEHALRGTGRPDPDRMAAPGLSTRVAADWICTPSAALGQGAFRNWSPDTRAGLEHLVDGLGRELDRGLGQVPVLRRWRDASMATAEGRTARSRLRDLVRLAAREPILTAPILRDRLGVSQRASFTLMDEAEAEGILTLITPRASWRVWARPDMAARLALRTRRAVHGGRAASGPGDLGTGLSTARPADPTRGAVEAETLEALDAAMARADAVLSRYAKGSGPET